MGWVNWFFQWRFHNEVLASIAAVVAAWLIAWIGGKIIGVAAKDARRYYRLRQMLNTVLLVLVVAALVILWAAVLKKTGTSLG